MSPRQVEHAVRPQELIGHIKEDAFESILLVIPLDELPIGCCDIAFLHPVSETLYLESFDTKSIVALANTPTPSALIAEVAFR